VRVTVWGEEFLDLSTLRDRPPPINYADYVDAAREIYPEDVHEAIADGLRSYLPSEIEVTTSSLSAPEFGLGEDVLACTDVLVWWSHVKHHLIPDEVVDRLWQRVRGEGLGLVMVHAGLESKIFRKLMGTTCLTGGWRQSDDWEAVWTVSPSHPIAAGIPPVFVIPQEEVYCEYFDIPQPDELVFLSTFRGGEVFRSGCCFQRGNGRIFYFRPGHESHPTYHDETVQRVLANAVCWAARPHPVSVDLALYVAQNPEEAKRRELLEGWFQAVATARR
jgi:trehalose utilization protein